MSFVNLLDIIYPIGSMYMSFNDTSPASIVGGSWDKIVDKCLRASDDTSVGGSDIHTLTTAQMPAHSHTIAGGPTRGQTGLKANTCEYQVASYSTNGAWTPIWGSGFNAVDTTVISTVGTSAAHNNLPAYQNLYCWRRTA